MRQGLLAFAIVLTMAVAVAAVAEAHTLTYRQARAAAQKKADAFAGMRTSVKSLLRFSRHRYKARAEWDYVDPTGCKGCVYDETTGTFRDGPANVQCSATVNVRYRSHRSRRPTAVVDEHACY